MNSCSSTRSLGAPRTINAHMRQKVAPAGGRHTALQRPAAYQQCAGTSAPLLTLWNLRTMTRIGRRHSDQARLLTYCAQPHDIRRAHWRLSCARSRRSSPKRAATLPAPCSSRVRRRGSTRSQRRRKTSWRLRRSSAARSGDHGKGSCRPNAPVLNELQCGLWISHPGSWPGEQEKWAPFPAKRL